MTYAPDRETYPFVILWGAGANSIGLHLPKIDRVRCTECGRWSREPAFYELDRVLCRRCHSSRVEEVRSWLARVV